MRRRRNRPGPALTGSMLHRAGGGRLNVPSSRCRSAASRTVTVVSA